MDASKYNFVSVNEILSDVLKYVDDERYEVNSKGYYISQIQQALEELSFDTFFDIRTYDCEFPTETLGMDMPLGSFNVKNIYLYNGTECDMSKSQKVWWKRNYTTKGGGYFADNKGHNNQDPFFPSNNYGGNSRMQGTNVIIRRPLVESHYFYNIQNGVIMFSSFCRNFQKVHIVFNGTGCDIGDIPVVPLFLRAAVTDYVSEVTLRIRMAKDKSYMNLWQIYDKNLNRDGKYGFGTGSWFRAEMRIKTMTSSERDDFYEYMGRNQWQSGM